MHFEISIVNECAENVEQEVGMVHTSRQGYCELLHRRHCPTHLLPCAVSFNHPWILSWLSPLGLKTNALNYRLRLIVKNLSSFLNLERHNPFHIKPKSNTLAKLYCAGRAHLYCFRRRDVTTIGAQRYRYSSTLIHYDDSYSSGRVD